MTAAIRERWNGRCIWLIVSIGLLTYSETPRYPSASLQYGDTVYLRHKNHGVTFFKDGGDDLTVEKLKLHLKDEPDYHIPFTIVKHNDEDAEGEVRFGDDILLQLSSNWIGMEEPSKSVQLYFSTSGNKLQISGQHELSTSHVFTICPGHIPPH